MIDFWRFLNEFGLKSAKRIWFSCVSVSGTTNWTCVTLSHKTQVFHFIFPFFKMTNAVQSSWADEIEEGDSTTLPLPTEKIQGNKKITTEYSIDDDGKKVKIVRTFEIIKKQVPKSVAQRKSLPKFGMSRNDRPGPDPATTIVAEEIFMNFIHNKEEHEKDGDEKSALERLGESNKGVVRCRICKEDHWTTNCPYKDKIGLLKELPGEEDKASPTTGAAPSGIGSMGSSGPASAAAGGPKAYVPPGRRDGARGGESMNDRRRSKFLIFFNFQGLAFQLSFNFQPRTLPLFEFRICRRARRRRIYKNSSSLLVTSPASICQKTRRLVNAKASLLSITTRKMMQPRP